MANDRIYYAIQQVGIKSNATSSNLYTPIHGVQSLDVSTKFDINTLFSLGLSDTYASYEQAAPNIDVRLSKVLDGYPPIFILATQDAITPYLLDRINSKSILGVSVFDETKTSATGEPIAIMQCSGLQVSSLKYKFSTKDNCTEEVGLIGHNKVWHSDPNIPITSLYAAHSTGVSFSGVFDGNDSPLSSIGISRRQDIRFAPDYLGLWTIDANGILQAEDCTILPITIPGISSSGVNIFGDSGFGSHIEDIEISVDISYDNIYGVGSLIPLKIPTLPIPVTTNISIVATSGDIVSAAEQGILSTTDMVCKAKGNITSQTIRIALCEGLRIYLGTENMLESVSYGGASIGGNVKLGFVFKNNNVCTILHPQDDFPNH